MVALAEQFVIGDKEAGRFHRGGDRRQASPFADQHRLAPQAEVYGPRQSCRAQGTVGFAFREPWRDTRPRGDDHMVLRPDGFDQFARGKIGQWFFVESSCSLIERVCHASRDSSRLTHFNVDKSVDILSNDFCHGIAS